MKKVLLFWIFLCVMSIHLFAGIEVTSSSAQELGINFTIPEVQFVEARYQDGNLYSKMLVPQASRVKVGKPDVPAFARWILIPNGTQVDISIYKGEPIVYENIELPPVQPSPSDQKDAPMPPFTKDENVYSKNADFPGIYAEAEPAKNKRGQSLTILWMYPYQYNPVKKTLTVYPDLEISVNFFGSIKPIPSNLKNENLELYLRSVAINADAVLKAEEDAEDMNPEDQARTTGCELLIISDPSFTDAANTLAAWKIRKGILTKVVTTTTTGGTNNQIDNYINNAYDNWSPAPSYFLFIGDAEDIPVWYDGNLGTDFFYADYDNPSDYVADFGYGRLSVDTDDEADSLVARIIRYERSPTTNSDYYDDILSAACFQDGEYWGDPIQYEEPDSVANRRFCKTSEDVRNYLHNEQGFPWSQREYIAYNRVSGAYPGEIFPRYWNDYSQQYWFIFENDTPGGSIPPSLRKPTFPWDGNTADISAAFNNGVHFALFRAHGSRAGWGDPDFGSWNVDALTNGEKRPIIWSMTCQSGWFDNETDDINYGTGWNDECFAEHWIRHGTGGSCGIIAATRNSYSGHNDRFIWGMMDAIWPSFLTWANDPYGGANPIYRMGDVINYGKDYMAMKYGYDGTSETTIELFHWFGDPTMEIWTSEPGEITSAEVTSNIDVGTSTITVQVYPSIAGFNVSVCTENADSLFGTAQTNASGSATVYLNHSVSQKDDIYVTITKHNYKPYEFVAGWVTWKGTVSSQWHNGNNWNGGSEPHNNIHVIIPSGTSYSPVISSSSGNVFCKDLIIESSATLTQTDDSYLYVYGSFDSDEGTFTQTGNAYLYFDGSANITWDDDNENDTYQHVRVFKDNSSNFVHMYQDMTVQQSFEIREGEFKIDASWTLTINGTTLNALEVEEGGKLTLSTAKKIVVAGGVEFENGSQENVTGGTIKCGKYFTIEENMLYNITFSGGTLEMNGSSNQYIKDYDGGTLELYNLTINKSGGACYVSEEDLEVNGDLTIQNGVFNPYDNTVFVGGDWMNNVGTSGFVEGIGRVVFNGTDHQYVLSDETFNILEVDCGAALRVNGVYHTVTCSTYDWTSGGIDVLAGTFTALDLADNGIWGGYWLNPGGTINLTQDGDQLIDLNGTIWMNGGTMNVYGGLGLSYWPLSEDASIEMSGGVLDFHDSSIKIYDSAYHTLTDDISGGTIRTAHSFYGNRTDFNPTGGTIELYGSANSVVSMGAGSNFYNLEINKFTPAEDGGILTKGQDFVIVKDRDGSEPKIEKSYTITAGSELDINGDFIIAAGVFNPNDTTMYVAGDWVNNVGDAGFLEGSGLVVFDGASKSDIVNEETFHDVKLDKTSTSYDALETGTGDDNGVNVTILHNLTLDDGSFELNNPTNLSIGNNIYIYSQGKLNANDTGTINISVVDDWFDYNNFDGLDAGSHSVVTFHGGSPGSIHAVSENEYFNDIILNSGASYLRPSIPGKTTIYCKNMDIQYGKLKISSYKVVIDDTLTVSDRLEMSSPEDTLIVGNIIWGNGSYDYITDGKIFVSGYWLFENGTDAQLEAGNNVYFDGSYNQFIYCMDPDAAFANVIIDKSNMTTLISNYSTENMYVLGDMTVTADDIFQVEENALVVNGILDIQDDGALYLEDPGGTLANYSDFTLYGELLIDGGEACLHNQFELASTGVLTIDSGSFVCDAPYTKNKALQCLYGTMNLSDGLFEITNNHISVKNSFVDNITGGIIRCGGTFNATTAGTFEPSGGTVELTSHSSGYYIQCTNGNYFYNLEVDVSPSIFLYDDTSVQNDLLITAGTLKSNNHYLYVGGDWTNNVGSAGFMEGTGKVIFNGNTLSDIHTDETFYDLSIDKTHSSWYDVEIMDGVTINVSNNLFIDYGTLEMNNNSTLNIGNDISINYDAGLNAYLDTGLTISIGGDWMNSNTIYDSYKGFYPGYSTVYFNGTDNQVLITSAPQEEFYNVIIDKSSHSFKPSDNIWIRGDLDVQNGTFSYNMTGLNHCLFGDVSIASTGFFYPSNTITFKGTGDQTFEHLGINNGYFNNVVIDKNAAKSAFNPGADEEGPGITYNSENSKSQSVILNSKMLGLNNGTLTVDQGTLDLNGNYYRCTGDVDINGGGKISIDDNAWLEVGNGYTLDVNDGGTLEVIGSAGNEAKVTHHYGYYDFHIEAGGTISAEDGIFEYMTGNGVYVKQNGLVDPSHAFNHCTFHNGTSGYAALLILNNDQTLTCTGAHFPGPIVTDINVWKYLDSGHVTFVNATGDFAGEGNEYDPYDRVDWTTSYIPPVDNLTIQYNSGTGEIEISWTYSTSCDSFYIYRDTDPYFTPITKHAAVSGATTTWSETASDTKYFYMVTAYNEDATVIMKQ